MGERPILEIVKNLQTLEMFDSRLNRASELKSFEWNLCLPKLILTVNGTVPVSARYPIGSIPEIHFQTTFKANDTFEMVLYLPLTGTNRAVEITHRTRSSTKFVLQMIASKRLPFGRTKKEPRERAMVN